MESKIILALIGFVVIISASIGYANTISVTGMNPLASSDNAVPQLNTIDLDQVRWLTSGSNYNQVEVSFTNADSVAHTYQVCAIFPNGLSISDTAGTSSDCVNTGTVNAGQSTTDTVTVSNPLPAHDGTTTLYIEVLS